MAAGFLLEPKALLHTFSASCHLGLLLVLFISWLYQRWKANHNHDNRVKNNKSWRQRQALCTSSGLALLYLLFCLLIYYHEDDGLSFAQLDLATRTVAWFAIFAYSLFEFSESNDLRFPIFLRIWWGLFLLLSSSFLVIDFICFSKHEFLHTYQWVLDFGSLLAGFIFGFADFFWKGVQEESPLLQEPLLNAATEIGSSSLSSSNEASFSLYENAGILSILTFSWVSPLIATGHRKALDLTDIPQLAGNDSVSSVLSNFKRKLDSCSTSRVSSSLSSGITAFKLAKALIFSAWEQVLLTAFLALMSTIAQYIGPFLIKYFVRYCSGDHKFPHEGLVLISAFLASTLVEGLADRHLNFRLQHTAIKFRASLVATIYQKGLNLSSSSRRSRSSGEIINYLTVDVNRVRYLIWNIHQLWLIPVQIILALLILYSSLGLASLITLSASFVIMLANIPIARLEENYVEKMMECTDNRMKATSEILKNIRILKLQAWEMKFLSKIHELRKIETNWLWKFSYLSAATSFLFNCSPTFVSALTFGACILMGIPLKSGDVLTVLATFSALQGPVYRIPDTISALIQTKVSLDRISSFLCLEELQPDAVQQLPRGSSTLAIQVSNGRFSWDLSSETPTLRDLNFQVLKGMKVAVCGTVGSGKSSFLSCMLGEIPKVSGSLTVCGTVAYVSQSPWIQSASIQENILFGKEMDTKKYDRVLEACALKRDLEIMPFGDRTIIGERGINLSGGQKQRIQIARAIYHDADIYLFDDPFSAVDAHTGSYLYKECLFGILAPKTLVYVTHQVEFLPSADFIVVMEDGRILHSGKYSEILNSGTNFMELVGAHRDALSSYDLIGIPADKTDTTKSNSFDASSAFVPNKEERDDSSDTPEDIRKTQIVQEEEREKGKVGFWVYWRYITMVYGGALVPLMLLSEIFFQVLQIASNYWMALAAPVSNGSEPRVSALMLISVYIAMAVGSSLFSLIRYLLLRIAGLKTATMLFNKMHMCIFHAPMSFFDSTPSGRILNRVSDDQSQVDSGAPFRVVYLAFSFIQLLGTVTVMSQVSWQVLVTFFLVMAICIWYQQYYLPTSRELTRLVGITKAPIVQHFAESLSGATLIRTFGKERKFVDDSCNLINNLSRLSLHYVGATEWFGVRLDMLSYLAFAVSLILLIVMPEGLLDPGMAGVSLIYGLSLNGLQAGFIWSLCSVANSIISVERILQYTDISTEPPLIIEASKPEHNWPSEGKIDLLNLQVKYGVNMPFVLKGLTCTFPGGRKIGIVGRTGSGKSTLIQTIFRIVDPTVGQILIDGIDISTIGLHDLRSRLSIIPQEPTMFEGTLRKNLDPLEEYTDEQIWKALDCCQLVEEIMKKQMKLESEVTENGENWSVGQRQLVCLGRVLLKKSKILVLDEATASVDTATDSAIQKTLRQEFSDATVITVAHRITSVLDSDMVLLLDNGMIAEYDIPTRLLQNKSSLFAKLVSEYTMRSTSDFFK